MFSLVLLTAVAGWEFIQWFLLEYWVFLLALASISAWALFRPGQKRARVADQHEQSD